MTEYHRLDVQLRLATLEALLPHLKRAVAEDFEGGEVLAELTNVRNEVWCVLSNAGVDVTLEDES